MAVERVADTGERRGTQSASDDAMLERALAAAERAYTPPIDERVAAVGEDDPALPF